MNFRKISIFFIFALFSAIAGPVLAAEMNSDENSVRIPLSPGIIVPGDPESGTLSIVPSVPGPRSREKIEYRSIFFGWGENKDRDKGTSSTSNQNQQSEQWMTAPDKDTGSSDQGNTGNKGYPVPPTMDQAKQPQSDHDSSSTPAENEGADSQSDSEKGGSADRSSSNKLQYVTNESEREYSPQDSGEKVDCSAGNNVYASGMLGLFGNEDRGGDLDNPTEDEDTDITQNPDRDESMPGRQTDEQDKPIP